MLKFFYVKFLLNNNPWSKYISFGTVSKPLMWKT